MAGLQGAGKTTSSGKLAKWLMENKKKKVLLVSCDVYRPAAIQQLELLANQTGADFYPALTGQKPSEIAANALNFARIQHHDVMIVDTAGRLGIDEGYDPAQAVLPVLLGTKPDWAILGSPDEVAGIERAALAGRPVSETEVAQLSAFLDALRDPVALAGRLGVPDAVPGGLPVDR